MLETGPHLFDIILHYVFFPPSMNCLWSFIILLGKDFIDLWSSYWHRSNIECCSPPILVSVQKCRSKEVLVADSLVDLLLTALCFPFPMLLLKQTESGDIQMCYNSISPYPSVQEGKRIAKDSTWQKKEIANFAARTPEKVEFRWIWYNWDSYAEAKENI